MEMSLLNNIIYITNFKEQSEKLEKYRLIRWQTALIINPHLKNPVQPADLLPLEGDKNSTITEVGNIEQINWDDLKFTNHGQKDTK